MVCLHLKDAIGELDGYEDPVTEDSDYDDVPYVGTLAFRDREAGTGARQGVIETRTHIFDISSFHPGITQTCKLLRAESFDLLYSVTMLYYCTNDLFIDYNRIHPEPPDLNTLGFPPAFLGNVGSMSISGRGLWFLPPMHLLANLKVLHVRNITLYGHPEHWNFTVDAETISCRLVEIWRECLDSDLGAEIQWIQEQAEDRRGELSIRCDVTFDNDEPRSTNEQTHKVMVSRIVHWIWTSTNSCKVYHHRCRGGRSDQEGMDRQ